MQEFLQNIDFVNLGSNIITAVGIILAIIIWFRKNVAGLRNLGGFHDLTNHIKALIKNDKNRNLEVSMLKQEIFELRKAIKEFIDKETNK